MCVPNLHGVCSNQHYLMKRLPHTLLYNHGSRMHVIVTPPLNMVVFFQRWGDCNGNTYLLAFAYYSTKDCLQIKSPTDYKSEGFKSFQKDFPA
jgi:hypothetical protein